MDKTISSFQEQNERQQNKNGCEYRIYDKDYGHWTQSQIVSDLTILSKEGWRIASSNIYVTNRFSGPQTYISIILERPIKT